MKLKYYLINKPFQVLSQFTKEHGNESLADYFKVEKDVYPVGRLDKDSEGLLLLTNDTSLNKKLLNPKSHIEKTYWVQVEKDISENALEQLRNGVEISAKGKKYFTKPAKVKKIKTPDIWERNPPVRFRKNIPTSWIEISIKEGKNRQIRKMTAKVGFPTLRLIRVKLHTYSIGNLQPGEMKILETFTI